VARGCPQTRQSGHTRDPLAIPCASGDARQRSVYRFLGLGRLGADRLCRPDAERPPRGGRRDFGLRVGSEEHPAARSELRFVPDHAGRDAVDIRDVGAAKPESIVAAGLLLLRGLGPACRGPNRNRERRCQHQAEPEIPGLDSEHESPPRRCFSRIVGEWRGNGKKDGASGLNVSWKVWCSLRHRLARYWFYDGLALFIISIRQKNPHKYRY
jgi:hypothetical protein